ncbi:DUF4913 domain-containing protein [Arthrobacter woluwensis]|uniref:DUF4913 domain-containing protein n=1 Tax=Arthrobacter woluwensis TaxID=156980 RepID=UPI00359002DF
MRSETTSQTSPHGARFRTLQPHRGHDQAIADHQLSQWWIHHWDAHARVLFSPSGPFESWRYGRHQFFNKSESYTPRLVAELPPPTWAP